MNSDVIDRNFLLQTAYSSTPELNRMNLNHSVPSYGLQQQQQHLNGGSTNINNNNNNNNESHILAELQRLNIRKPPPPYPGTFQLHFFRVT